MTLTAIRKNDGFKGLVNFVDLSVKLIQTNRHTLYDMVYLLLKLVLLLPVAMASVERLFLQWLQSKLRKEISWVMLF